MVLEHGLHEGLAEPLADAAVHVQQVPRQPVGTLDATLAGGMQWPHHRRAAIGMAEGQHAGTKQAVRRDRPHVGEQEGVPVGILHGSWHTRAQPCLRVAVLTHIALLKNRQHHAHQYFRHGSACHDDLLRRREGLEVTVAV